MSLVTTKHVTERFDFKTGTAYYLCTNCHHRSTANFTRPADLTNVKAEFHRTHAKCAPVKTPPANITRGTW